MGSVSVKTKLRSADKNGFWNGENQAIWRFWLNTLAIKISSRNVADKVANFVSSPQSIIQMVWPLSILQ